MKSLEQLLAEWEAGSLTPEDLADLKHRLATPEARAELVEDWLLNEAIYDTLRSRPTEAMAAVPAEAAAPPSTRSARVPQRRAPFGWLVWREVRIPLRWPLRFAVALCILLLGLHFHFEHASIGQIAQVRSPVVLERGSKKLNATPGQALYPGDRLRIGPSSAATVSWADEPTSLDLVSGSDVQFLNPLRGKSLLLQAGQLQASVAPQSHWRTMVIRTPQAEAKIVGTRFSLSVTGATTRIEVLEGAVRFRKTHLTTLDTLSEVIVRAGQAAGAAPDAKLALELVTGFLASDVWAVPAGTPFSDAAARGTWVVPMPGAVLANGSNYIERLRGYLIAPATGEFTFWIASFQGDLPAELWISGDEDSIHARPIALSQRVPAPTAPPGRRLDLNAALQADWQRFPSQKSGPQKLVQGRRYYLEIWHQGLGLEALALGWRLPDQPASSPPKRVDFQALCPYVENPASDSRQK